MRDINLPLRKKYNALLSGIVYNSLQVPCFYNELPSGNTAKNYIIFGQINNNDAGTKQSNDTSTTIQVGIYTYDERNNTGDAADVIAGQVMQIIYPDKQNSIDLSTYNLQCITTELAVDRTEDYGIQSDRKYLNRFISFRHVILQQ